MYVDWSELAATGLQPDPTRASIRAAQNARTAGIRAARLLRDLGIGAGDHITHVTHGHGQFVAEAIALRLDGTHKLLALAPENPVGQGFRRPDYDRAFGDGNAVQFVTHRSIFADDVFPQTQVPRGFDNDNASFGDAMDIIRNNLDTIETTVGFYGVLNDFGMPSPRAT